MAWITASNPIQRLMKPLHAGGFPVYAKCREQCIYF